MGKRIYRRNGGLAVADAEDAGLFRQRGKSPIVERSPISKTISLLVETDDRRDHHIRLKFRAIGGDRNVPDSQRQWLADAPKSKDQGSIFLHDNGECAGGAPRADRGGPASEIWLSTKRPIEADGKSRRDRGAACRDGLRYAARDRRDRLLKSPAAEQSIARRSFFRQRMMLSLCTEAVPGASPKWSGSTSCMKQAGEAYAPGSLSSSEWSTIVIGLSNVMLSRLRRFPAAASERSFGRSRDYKIECNLSSSSRQRPPTGLPRSPRLFPSLRV